MVGGDEGSEVKGMLCDGGGGEKVEVKGKGKASYGREDERRGEEEGQE